MTRLLQISTLHDLREWRRDHLPQPEDVDVLTRRLWGEIEELGIAGKDDERVLEVADIAILVIAIVEVWNVPPLSLARVFQTPVHPESIMGVSLVNGAFQLQLLGGVLNWCAANAPDLDMAVKFKLSVLKTRDYKGVPCSGR